MYKLVLDDYRHQFRSGLKNASYSGWFIYFYLLLLYPIWGKIMNLQLLHHIFTFIPLLTALLLSRMYGGVMSKTFFLCPLSQEQREEYIRTGIFIRIALSVTLFILMNSILVITGLLSPWLFLIKLFIMVCASISYNIYCQPTEKSPDLIDRTYPFTGNYKVWNALSQVFGIFNMVLFNAWDGTETTDIKWFLAILLVMQLYICIHMLRHYYRQVMHLTTLEL